MKKAIGQTVRDLKRGVNKKVLKVPGIEQKVLDSTSNEPWGPHGTLLAEIAQASRNYPEYQMIMGVIWKRVNDTGKNWRHVYKALTVLEYLVAHGSERVVDDIREHAYQISTLSDFQYIDSNGRDQGNNVRRKAQSLVVLVNDKERVAEVRQKAATNREKFHNGSSAGGMYRPSGGYGDRYEEDKYGRRDDYDYGRESDKEWGYRDEDRYSRNGDSYGRDGDRHSRDSEDRYSRDNYRDDDMGGRSRSVEDFQNASRSRSHDGDRDRGLDDDGQYSSRESVVKADEASRDDRSRDRKFSEQDIGAPPNYEEAVSESRSPVRSEKDVEASVSSIPKPSSSPVTSDATPPAEVYNTSVAPPKQEVETFDEFDPRGPLQQGATGHQNTAEIDLLGSLSDSFSPNPLAIMPAPSSMGGPEADPNANSGLGATFAPVLSPSVLSDNHQGFDDPFGDSPFKAIPSMEGAPVQPQTATPTNSFSSVPNEYGRQPENSAPPSEAAGTYDFGGGLSGLTYTPSASNVHPSPPDQQTLPADLSNADQSQDILADILPPSGPYTVTSSQPPFYYPNGQSSQSVSNPYGDHISQSGSAAQIPQMQSSAPLHYNNSNVQPAQSVSNPYGDHISQPGIGSAAPVSHMQSSAPMHYNNNSNIQTAQSDSNPYGDQKSQLGSAASVPQMNSPALVPYNNKPGVQPSQSISNPYGDHISQPGSAAQIPQMQSPAPPQYNGGNFQQQMGYFATMNMQPQYQTSAAIPPGSGSFHPQSGFGALQHPQMASNSTQPTSMSGASYLPPGSSVPMGNSNSAHQQGFASPAAPQAAPNAYLGSASQPNKDTSNFFSQAGQSNVLAASTGASLAVVPQPSKEKFETKSTVWADTLSRGLVNLNISGPKTNPLADIGVDFDAINRREKRMEKQPAAPVTSTVTMGKAMGSGSGIGRASASSLRAPPNPMMGSGMGMGVGMGAGGGQGSGMGMGGYGMNQPMGMGYNNMGMGPNMGYNNMGMSPNMGYNNLGMGMNNRPMMGQGGPMQQGTGLPPGSAYPAGYNPMMGGTGYPQQPYGGGYR
ncbi:hypothetical protein MLD38_036297 [Melastoma candidum]|uniref:Uncharacterized protein n=1 Tax=Melastoma candidum TaxID=119954 RepID=A0ACB9LIS0_9MYRT|nr:hypothetical protein MLD38_036297 [Melastoma candidum]